MGASISVALDLLILLSVIPPVAVSLLVRYLWTSLLHLLLSLNASSPQSPPSPPPPHPSLLEPATVVASKLRDGTYTSVGLVRAALAQARRVNAALNAVTSWRDEAVVLAEAAAADVRLAAARRTPSPSQPPPLAPLPPFLGVPCSVKECFATPGLVCQTSGVLARRQGRPAAQEATVVRRLRADGGLIPLCNTNTSELCMWFESSNLLHGRTRNAYDGRRIVGGSSGGEAALISAAGVLCGVGSDIGGSLRNPGAFNGVYAHKPTGGLCPSTGQHPSTPHAFLTTGPIARYAADLGPLLALMQGPDGEDAACVPTPLRRVDLPVQQPLVVAAGKGGPTGSGSSSSSPSPCLTSWSDVTVHVVPWPALDAHRPPLSTRVQPSIRAVIDAAATTLCGRYGCRGPVDFSFPEFAEAFDLWAAVLGDAPGNPVFAALMAEAHHGWQEGGGGGGAAAAEPPRLWLAAEALKWSVGLSSATLPAALLGLFEHLPKALLPARHRRLLATVAALKARIHATLGGEGGKGLGVLLFPAYPTTAPKHDHPLVGPMNVSYTAIFNVLETPSTAVPCGLEGRWRGGGGRGEGLPVGFQVIGPRGGDHLTIAVAQALEASGVAGWVPPALAGVAEGASSVRGKGE
jgi:fatty acid amide hydrolase 2